ncbi:MAG: 2-oxoglutarate dehydrogenase complex dihydrolipoyllysine-residue succinyltransferase [Gammaproteobacteria bacterium]|nr:2-oxoglutarate dehydrogenase complex dihydrolipoyllysine-residue succinyltransferase [Gammaproteobacteria bacterium]MDH5801669.1 2-oxoglutarate dehydrogenase complex dihydrolipoyllysine-residue succinyltransferase [Gammaproteobacteria bacterium]
MLVEVKVPVLAESISEATLMNWHKKIGDAVHAEENLVDLETDKVVLEVVSPKQGVLKEIRKPDGANVLSDEVIAVIDTDGVTQTETAVNDDGAAAVFPEPYEVTKIPPAASTYDQELSPAVRKLVAENDVDPNKIIGTGKDGRLTKSDVLKYLETVEKVESEPVPLTPSKVPDVSLPRPGVDMKPVSDGLRPERRVPMSRLRARIAERLKEAQNTAAILTTFNEINMQPVMDLRNKYKDRFLKRHNVKLGFMSFFVKAAVEALKQYPVINASVEENEIIYHGFYDIGIAVSSPRGLVVPILRDVDQMSFANVEAAISGFGEKARDGRLTIQDLTGGTFSISNGGVFGSMLSTPILNPPQSAILGMHNITQRPMVENGEIVVRPMMYVALSYDHRIIDGKEAVLFLVAIKQALEDPARMLLDI